MITPVQKRLEYEGRYPFGEPAALPAVGCIARFRSQMSARDHERDCSDLTVIWFQEDFAFPISEEIEQAILDIDWERFARDGDY